MRGARRAAESFRSCARILTLLSLMLPDTDEGNALKAERDRLEKEFNALVTLEGDALDQAVRRLEFDVLKLERDLEAFDRALPMGWFRQHFDDNHASSVALADYASLLGRYVGDNLLRLDRIQFLLARVVNFFMSPEDDTPARRRELLSEALPPVHLDDATRQTAVAFLRDAARRAASFTAVKELVSSGFFVDIRGYKLSLRNKLLDPDVMSAAIELNEAVNDCLIRLTEIDPSNSRDLDAHVLDVDKHLKSIFRQLRDDETTTQSRFDDWLRRNAEKRKAGAKSSDFVPSGPGKALRVDRRVIMAVVAVVLVVVTVVRWPGGARLTELSTEDIASLSPLLAAGSVAPTGRSKIFVGQIDKSRWALMPLDARRAAAQTLANKLAERKWLFGTVMLEEQVVVQIEEGHLILVQ